MYRYRSKTCPSFPKVSLYITFTSTVVTFFFIDRFKSYFTPTF